MPISDYSVKFGREPDMGFEKQKAFPYIYTFVNYMDNEWVKNLNITTVAQAVANLSGIGPLVPHATLINEEISGVTVPRWIPGYRQIKVMLDPDYNFKLLSIKYTAYHTTISGSRTGSNPVTTWYEDLPLPESQYPYLFAPSYDPTVSTPVASATGDTYFALATANGWTVGHHYRYNGATWDDVSNQPLSPYFYNYLVFDNTIQTPLNPSVGDTWQAGATANGWTLDKIYRWSGTAWVNITAAAVTVHYGDTFMALITTVNPLPAYTAGSVYRYEGNVIAGTSAILSTNALYTAQWTDITLLYQTTEGLDPGMDVYGTPLAHFIKVALSFQGSGSRMLYGGQDSGAIVNPHGVNGRIPLPIDVIQGYEYGFLTTKTPYLLPRQGIMSFDVYNYHHTKDLVVGAAIYGLKIRM